MLEGHSFEQLFITHEANSVRMLPPDSCAAWQERMHVRSLSAQGARHFWSATQSGSLSQSWICLQHFDRAHMSHAGRLSTDACFEQSGAGPPESPLVPLEPRVPPVLPLVPLEPPSLFGSREGKPVSGVLELLLHPTAVTSPAAVTVTKAKNAVRNPHLPIQSAIVRVA